MIKNQAGAMAPPDPNLNLSLHLDHLWVVAGGAG
jgi:hypothetical protein